MNYKKKLLKILALCITLNFSGLSLLEAKTVKEVNTVKNQVCETTTPKQETNSEVKAETKKPTQPASKTNRYIMAGVVVMCASFCGATVGAALVFKQFIKGYSKAW
mgnify:CR=1 FL=1